MSLTKKLTSYIKARLTHTCNSCTQTYRQTRSNRCHGSYLIIAPDQPAAPLPCQQSIIILQLLINNKNIPLMSGPVSKQCNYQYWDSTYLQLIHVNETIGIVLQARKTPLPVTQPPTSNKRRKNSIITSRPQK